MNHWIFQGRPDRFDIDDYVARYSQLVYWSTNRFNKNSSTVRIQIGDMAFIWRASREPGLIAIGEVTELPTPAHSVSSPEALAEDMWKKQDPKPDEIKTGIRISQFRLTSEEGMVRREQVQQDDLLAESSIIKQPQGSVFRLDDVQAARLMKLWNDEESFGPYSTDAGTFEGRKRLRVHYVRERSRLLREFKIKDMRAAHGRIFCEVCKSGPPSNLPTHISERMFEVHHVVPLSETTGPTKTRVSDLIVVCANCHRMIHASAATDENKNVLREKLGKS